ncbi:GAF and ANTAR domain-containing protein [Paeniglutamicibacter psychrophenolicus]|uniref:GAF and ANTAR domain-containing protein n=1 Tax=Paeniglutamicibacter psychrophenolicus TaxID=257454 RepID=UPI00277D8836|nr:GAF and ANTAR domain-containing protein [Paeniglutamicibacter psychrophenolicus]MDQ0096128.1 GAF domain-containing protein [Paeniglutamicibacter psychrophenolicus]
MIAVSEFIRDLLAETHDLESFLNALTHLSANTLGNGDEPALCGITLRRHKRAGTVASNSALAQELDELQYDFGEGPCLSACIEHRTVHIPDVERAGRWPEYIEAIKATGVRSMLAVPFTLETEDTAAINLYSMHRDAFDERVVEQVEEYAHQASALLNLAVRMARHRDNEENLRLALESRTTIDLAVGIIMGQNKCSQERAVQILKSASSSRNIKVRHVAEAVIASTTNQPVDTHFEN